MNFEDILNKLNSKFSDKIIASDAESIDKTVTVDPKSMKEIMAYLKDDAELQFDLLHCITGIDHDDENLRVVYNLVSVKNSDKLTVFAIVPKSDPHIESLDSLWRSADWHERETYDLMGVTFDNHPDHRRILLPDDWEGHPLRKDYETPETYNGIVIAYPEEEQKANYTKNK